MPQIPRLTIATIQQRLGVRQPNPNYVLHRFDAAHRPHLEACRMDVYFIALLHRGELLVESDLLAQRVQAPAVFAMAPAVLRRFVANSEDFVSEVIFFDGAFLLEPLADATYLSRFAFFHHGGQHLLPLPAARYREFNSYLGLIRRQVKKSGPQSADIVRHVLHLLLHELAATRPPLASDAAYSHNELVTITFRQHLEQHFSAERKVSYYAAQQHLSPKYFSSLIRQQTGKTAGELIDERVLLEARALLQHPELTVAQVAQQLGFDDASNFGKYFRKLTGLPPLRYRQAARG